MSVDLITLKPCLWSHCDQKIIKINQRAVKREVRVIATAVKMICKMLSVSCCFRKKMSEGRIWHVWLKHLGGLRICKVEHGLTIHFKYPLTWQRPTKKLHAYFSLSLSLLLRSWCRESVQNNTQVSATSMNAEWQCWWAYLARARCLVARDLIKVPTLEEACLTDCSCDIL